MGERPETGTTSARIPGGSVIVEQRDLTTLHQQLTAVMELTQP
jgi:hypothetical protein